MPPSNEPPRAAILAGLGFETGMGDGDGPERFYRRTGSGPLLLCLHGLGDSGLTFAEFLASPPLEEFPALVPDVPGFGWSPRRGAADLRAQARWILEFLDRMRKPAFVAVGHSMGGATAIHLAEVAPDRCLGILSIEGNMTYGDCTLSAEAVAADREGRYPAWRETIPPRMLLDAEARHADGERRFAATFPLADPASYLEAAYSLVEESTESRLGHRYRALAIPRLYIHGGMSSHPETHAFIRDHGLAESFHPASRHWPHWDARDAVANACRGFLDAL